MLKQFKRFDLIKYIETKGTKTKEESINISDFLLRKKKYFPMFVVVAANIKSSVFCLRVCVCGFDDGFSIKNRIIHKIKTHFTKRIQ